ncbi:MAG: LCP family protein [Thermoleophilaceae bacterium]|nr:LCP family protein [Thermoleophilaceae bacterium]
MSPLFEDIPKSGFWKRLVLGAALVIFATAGATSVAAFREVDKVVDALKESESLNVANEVAEAPTGNPQTIMLLGSDRRPDNATDGGAGTGARSDTIILVRLDPDRGTALMSLPRDLKVQIPGHGTDKINAAYDLGGPKLTLQTVKRLTGLPVNHVINVDFDGFRKAVDALGCIYADIDRRYFNDSADFAYINVYPGYQKLCGEEALEYARFRHEDSDLVRSARQQEILRAAKQQIGAGKLLGDRNKLIRIFGKNTTSDLALKKRSAILRLLKLAVFSVDQPIREVHFEGRITDGNEAQGVPSYVTASDAAVKKFAQQFLGVEDTPGARGQPERRRGGKRGQSDGGLIKSPEAGKDLAVRTIRQGGEKRLPVYYPTAFRKGSLFTEAPRAYRIKDPAGRIQRGYRMVIARGITGEYYGVQGTTWKRPPILESEFDEKRFGGRTFEIHRGGDRVRLVAWRTSKGSYWVSNTLLQSLTERQMLAVARSTRLP